MEVRAKIIAHVADLVAGLTDSDEELLALGDIAGLLDFGSQFRDEVILGRAAAGVQLGQHGSRTLSNHGIGVTDELRNLHGAELHRGERLGLKSVQDKSGPLGTTDECGV